MKKKEMMLIAAIFFVYLGFYLGSIISCKRLDPSRFIHSWRMEKAEANTKVWCLAKKAAGNKFDLQDVSFLIAQKNQLVDHGLTRGQEIWVPVFDY